MKSKDRHVTMPTEDHHGNTSVKVYGLVLSAWLLNVIMGIKDGHSQEDTLPVNKPNLSENVSK